VLPGLLDQVNLFTKLIGMRRVNLRDIAKAAEVSLATVSYALRDHEKIPKATRKRIQALSLSLGYRPDPSLAVLGARRWGGRTGLNGLMMTVIAPPRQQWTTYQERCFAGSQEQADRLGYRLQHFAVEDFSSPAEMGAVLERRSCGGVILRRIQQESQLHGFPFERFAIVACGHGAVDPRCHIVMPHHHHNFMAVWRRMRRHGVRRIGVVLLEGDALAELPRFYTGAMLQAQEELPARQRIPAFVCSAYDRARFSTWLNRHRPEAIIGCVDRVWTWLSNARLGRMPLFASLEKGDPGDGRLAGIDLRPQLMGSAAVDQLDRAIKANERGLPEIRQIIQIESPWCPGESLPEPDKTPAAKA